MTGASSDTQTRFSRVTVHDDMSAMNSRKALSFDISKTPRY